MSNSQELLSIDFKTTLRQERASLLGMISDACFIGDEIVLDRPFETYSRGEQAIIKFVQSPQEPFDFSKVSNPDGAVALLVHTLFWKQHFGVTERL